MAINYTKSRKSQSRKKSFYDSSLLKRRVRRSDKEIGNLLAWIQYILSDEDGQITIRHLYYRLVGHGIIEKTEQAYQSLVRHLSNWRRSGAVAWDAFADSTRWHIKGPTFDCMREALDNTVATYRRNLWSTQKIYLELWCEKDAMAGIISKAAEPFGVPIFVARGFASLTSLYNAANTFREWSEAGKKCLVYHFGDYDPSGIAAGTSIIRAFRDDFQVDVEFSRAAVTPEQIKRLQLPTRPVKVRDSRAAKWTGGECVELDTMLSADIRALVESCITRHIDQYQWEQAQLIEKAERETLRKYADNFSPSDL
jgi:hypothetical protein